MAQLMASESASGYGRQLEAVAARTTPAVSNIDGSLTPANRALGSVIAALFGLVIASAGAAALAGLLLLAAVGLGLFARHWLSLAGRSRVGARSEDRLDVPREPRR